MPDITNNAGSNTGVQNLGNIAIRVGRSAVAQNPSSGEGNFIGNTPINVSDIENKYIDRFDETEYYE